MTRRLAQFLLASWFLVIPSVAQRGGGFHGGMGGFHGGGFAGPGFRGGFVGRGFRGYGFFPGNRLVFGFGFPGYWPYYGAGWGYPYYGYYAYPFAYSYPYPNPNAYSYPYGYGYGYSAPEQNACPQANGRPLYLIKLTYQNNIWVAQEYWYTAGTLNFVTLQGEVKKTPLSSMDGATTFQLNQNCGVNFQLPA
jgi:hypothetical protein